MAKQGEDLYTRDLFGRNPVGRPKKQKPLTPAQRAAAYRQRQKFNMLISVTRHANSEIDGYLVDHDLTE